MQTYFAYVSKVADMVTCGVATILVNRCDRPSKKMYDKECARTSKLCYESLALGENEWQCDDIYDWETGWKRDGRGKQQPEYITMESATWAKDGIVQCKWLSGVELVLLIHRILTIFCRPFQLLMCAIGEVDAIDCKYSELRRQYTSYAAPGCHLSSNTFSNTWTALHMQTLVSFSSLAVCRNPYAMASPPSSPSVGCQIFPPHTSPAEATMLPVAPESQTSSPS